MTSPTALYVVGVAVFTMLSAGFCSAVTVLVSWLLVTPFADAVATFVTDPKSRSACVIVDVALQVVNPPGAKPPAGQVTVALSSNTVTGPASVTLPVLVTLYE